MERFAALPGLERIEQKPQLNAGGAWTLPNGSVLVQTLSLDLARRRRQAGPQASRDPAAGPPAGGMDRLLLPLERRADRRRAGPRRRRRPRSSRWPTRPSPSGRREQTWRFPARTECLVCHSRAAGFILGFTPLQLDRDHDYGGVRRQPAPHARAHRRLPGHAARRGAKDRPRLVNPYDDQGPARGPGQVVPARQLLDLPRQRGRRQLPHGAGPRQPARPGCRLIDEVPIHDRFDIADARLVAPGSPERSVLYQRISRRGTGQMPPLVSTEVDRDAVEMIADWIRGLPRASR